MQRIQATPREDWQTRVADAGGQPAWSESAFYELTAKEVEAIEAATNELVKMTLAAAQHVIENRLYSRLAIPDIAVPLIERSWQDMPPSLYGRFDLAYDGVHPPKLLEYDADTPAMLLEAAVLQRDWQREVFPDRRQFNLIHQKLVERWQRLAGQLPRGHIDLCSLDDAEGRTTVAYLRDTAQEAGLTAAAFPIDEIGWDGRSFLGPDNLPLDAVFKLYPWEWMVREEFGPHLASAGTMWIEPPWKMLLANKGLLPVLWKMYPRHPNLLEAHFDSPGLAMSWVKKPLLGREGANITLHQPGKDFETGGRYGAEGFIYQDLAPPASFDGVFPVFDSWVAGHEEGKAACGFGVRESETPISSRESRFVPHLVE